MNFWCRLQNQAPSFSPSRYGKAEAKDEARDTAALPSRAVPRLHHSTTTSPQGPRKSPPGGCPINTGTPGAQHGCSFHRLTQRGQDRHQGAVLRHLELSCSPLRAAAGPKCVCQRCCDLSAAPQGRQRPGTHGPRRILAATSQPCASPPS